MDPKLQHLISFLHGLKKREDLGFLSDIEDLKKITAVDRENGEKLLVLALEILLRNNKTMCSMAGILLRQCLEGKFISAQAGADILYSCEKHAVSGFDPNLEAGVYEHLSTMPGMVEALQSWKQDSKLKRKFVRVSGYFEDEADQLDALEWGLKSSEMSDVRYALKNSKYRLSKFRGTKYQKRWEGLFKRIKRKAR